MAMFAYKEEHPDVTFASIAEIFTEQLNKKIHRTMVQKNYHKIKKQKEEGLEIKIECMLTNRLLLAITLK